LAQRVGEGVEGRYVGRVERQGRAATPSASISATTSRASVSLVRYVMTTSAPAAARASAVARPRPRLPPVMRAMGLWCSVVMDHTVNPRGGARKRPVRPGIGDLWIRICDRRILGSVDPEQLADFLRHRREALQPEDVGLMRGPRRRTSGLRREEVALLASMSTTTTRAWSSSADRSHHPQCSPRSAGRCG
jgi:hypothetical protein